MLPVLIVTALCYPVIPSFSRVVSASQVLEALMTSACTTRQLRALDDWLAAVNYRYYAVSACVPQGMLYCEEAEDSYCGASAEEMSRLAGGRGRSRVWPGESRVWLTAPDSYTETNLRDTPIVRHIRCQ